MSRRPIILNFIISVVEYQSIDISVLSKASGAKVRNAPSHALNPSLASNTAWIENPRSRRNLFAERHVGIGHLARLVALSPASSPSASAARSSAPRRRTRTPSSRRGEGFRALQTVLQVPNPLILSFSPPGRRNAGCRPRHRSLSFYRKEVITPSPSGPSWRNFSGDAPLTIVSITVTAQSSLQ